MIRPCFAPFLLILASFTHATSGFGQDSPHTDTPRSGPKPETILPAAANSPIRKKLSEIVIPSIELQDTPLSATLEFLQAKSFELDLKSAAESQRGVNIVLLEASDGGPFGQPAQLQASDRAITAQLADIPLGEAINLVAQLAECRVRVDSHAVVLIPLKPGESAPFAADDPELVAAQRKYLSAIILPSLEFNSTPLSHALEFITQKAAELGPKSAEKSGFHLILRPGPGELPAAADFAAEADAPVGPADSLITLKLSHIPVLDALQYIAALAGCELYIGNTSVMIQPAEKNPLQP